MGIEGAQRNRQPVGRLSMRQKQQQTEEISYESNPFDVSPEQLSECPPRTQVAHGGQTERENKLKRDAIGQALRHAAVLDRPGDIPAQGRLRVSWPACARGVLRTFSSKAAAFAVGVASMLATSIPPRRT